MPTLLLHRTECHTTSALQQTLTPWPGFKQCTLFTVTWENFRNLARWKLSKERKFRFWRTGALVWPYKILLYNTKPIDIGQQCWVWLPHHSRQLSSRSECNYLEISEEITALSLTVKIRQIRWKREIFRQYFPIIFQYFQYFLHSEFCKNMHFF